MELLDAGEIEAERDPRTGRWSVPKDSLNASETERLTELLTEGEDELRARLQTTEEALSALEERARALRKERDRLREELEAERSKGFWRSCSEANDVAECNRVSSAPPTRGGRR